MQNAFSARTSSANLDTYMIYDINYILYRVGSYRDMDTKHVHWFYCSLVFGDCPDCVSGARGSRHGLHRSTGRCLLKWIEL